MPRPSVCRIAVAVALLAGACSSGGGGAEPATSTTPPTTAASFRVNDGDEGGLVVDTGDFALRITTDPLRLRALDEAGPFFVEGGGLYLVRNGGAVDATTATVTSATSEQVALRVAFSDGSTGHVELRPRSPGTVAVTLSADDPAGVTAWGERLTMAADEQIYGLTERTVDDLNVSEINPGEAGGLNRRGQVIHMSVTPTMSAYAPFHQSSAGYGLLVGGTMPGVYDIGSADPDVLKLEFEVVPGQPGGGFSLFHGPDGPSILHEYTRLTGRPPVPPEYVFHHWRGRDEIAPGPPVEVDGVAINPTVAEEIRKYDELGLPAPGIFHFDRPWATGPEGYGDFVFDPVRFPNAAGMLRVLTEHGWHPMVWISNWAIGARGDEARAQGYLAPGSDRAIDLTNPDAAAWFRDGLKAFLQGPEGRYVSAFYIDRSDEPDVPSAVTDVWADGRTGREVHNAYPVLLQKNVRRVLHEVRPDDGWAVARAAYTGTQHYVGTWGGDTHSRNGIIVPEAPPTGASTDLGLRSVLISMQRAAYMGLPYWGSDIGGYSEFADREVFARWIEVGAASPLMRFHGQGSDAPWDMPTEPHDDAQMTDIYRRYVDLHDSLAGYLHGLAEEAHASGITPVRPLAFRWPDERSSFDRWDEWLLGDDLLVAPVWRSGERDRAVWFPPGRWVDVWDRDTVIDGPTTRTVHAPLDTLPLYAAEGSAVLDQLADVP